jgi:hypothetical protein
MIMIPCSTMIQAGVHIRPAFHPPACCEAGNQCCRQEQEIQAATHQPVTGGSACGMMDAETSSA